MLNNEDKLAFIPGPLPLVGTMDSQDVQDIQEYDAESVLRAFDVVFGPRAFDGHGDWFAHQWEVKRGRHLIRVGFYEMGRPRGFLERRRPC